MPKAQPNKPQNTQLNSHYNASQLRADTWNRLKYKAQKLSQAANTPDVEHKQAALLENIQQYLAILEPIEYYWAFPGKDNFKEVKRLFERSEYRLFSNRIDHIVHILFSEAYRTNPAWVMHSEGDNIRAQASIHRAKRTNVSPEYRHYFELLYVANISAEEEHEIRGRLATLQDNHSDFIFDIVFVPSFEDALIAVMFNYNIQACIIHYGFAFKSKMSLEILQDYLRDIEDPEIISDNFSMEHGSNLGRIIHKIRPELDLYLKTDAFVEDFATYDVHQSFRRVFYGKENYIELYLSIRRGIDERYETPFFNALVHYSQRPTGVFHALPVSRGHSVFRSHWIQDLGKFYGTNLFLAETSATTGGLDSLLQPKGPLKKAQEMAGRTFGSQHTFFITNGTSTANKIVLQALTTPGDIVLIDRDCHKSHHYGLVLTGAYPVYLDSYPLVEYSMYGAVPLREIKHKLLDLMAKGNLHKVKMLLLTNSTFDGIVYNVERVMEEVLAIKPDMIFLWDEAWFGFARFSPIMKQRTAMQGARTLIDRFQSTEYRAQYLEYRKKMESIDPADHETLLNMRWMPDPDKAILRVYATQSTHKTLTALRQGGMIHIYDQEYARKAEDAFHEAYMTHTSTSPNYQILASLDVGRRQCDFEGFEMVQKSIENAMTLREKLKSHPLLKKYFFALGPADCIPDNYRPSGLQYYYDIRSGWGRMSDAWKTDEFVLDPTRITLAVGNAGIDGNTFKESYLMDKYGIQVNKTSRNTVLFMTNIGTSRSAVAFLIGVLVKIAQELQEKEKQFSPLERANLDKKIKSLTVELPPLPDFSYFHKRFLPYPGAPAGDLRSAYYMAAHEENTEYIKMDGSIARAIDSGREVVSAVFVTPYPPGFPVLVPGQVVTHQILSFLKALDVKEIHGYRPELGLRVFTEAALADHEPPQTNGVAAAEANGHPKTVSDAEVATGGV
jgi:arginine decarboxylase